MIEMLIRSVYWDYVDKRGVPKDCLDVMNYFNEGLKSGKYHFIPRKSKITEEEILNLWVPAKDKNVSLVAVMEGKVIGSGTVLFDSGSNKYGLESGREAGEYSLSVDEDYDVKRISYEITKKMLEEGKNRGFKFGLHVYSLDEVMIGVMRDLFLLPKKVINNYQRFVEAGLEKPVYFYELP